MSAVHPAPHGALSRFSEPTRAWFGAAGPGGGADGSRKTLSAFLRSLDEWYAPRAGVITTPGRA